MLLFSYLVTAAAAASVAQDNFVTPRTVKVAELTTTIESRDQKDNEDDDIERKGWLLWVQISCLVLAALGLVAKVYSKCKDCCKCCTEWHCNQRDEEDQIGSEMVICYLCNKKVARSEWEKQETGHRSYCAVKSKEHRDVLSEMPRTSLPCDNCGELLRIWPSNMGPVQFRCSDDECWSKGDFINNDGTNRFNCFTCDLDLCRECGNAEMADAKELKDDPLVLAASIIKHRGSRASVKALTNQLASTSSCTKRKPIGKKQQRRRSSVNPSSLSLSSSTPVMSERRNRLRQGDQMKAAVLVEYE